MHSFYNLEYFGGLAKRRLTLEIMLIIALVGYK